MALSKRLIWPFVEQQWAPLPIHFEDKIVAASMESIALSTYMVYAQCCCVFMSIIGDDIQLNCLSTAGKIITARHMNVKIDVEEKLKTTMQDV
ncbi:hypothetical protein NHQ30_009653 [Ciborinia camelliae]|nr:hypothetical protein NHQ30_009653 [Ciborinia camelliae]